MEDKKTLAEKKAIKTFESINEYFIVYYEDDVKQHINRALKSLKNSFYTEDQKNIIKTIFKEEFGELVE